MSYQFTVAIQYDLVDGLTPVFVHQNGPNPFDLEDWPTIRQALREEITDEIPEEFETYLHSDRVGERFEYTVGKIIISEDGKLEEKRYDMSVSSLREAFEER